MIIAPHFPAWVDAADSIPGARQAIEWRAAASLQSVRARVRPELQLHIIFTTRPLPALSVADEPAPSAPRAHHVRRG